MGTPIRHPLIDAITARAVRVDIRAAVARLSPPLADLLSKPVPRGRRIVLVTPETTCITVGLRAALVAANGVWVVETPGGFRDGITGIDRSSIDEAAQARQPSLDPDADGGLPPATLMRSDAETTQLGVDVTILHRPSHDTLLGGALEAIASAIGQPDGGYVARAWGSCEPLDHPWDRWVLTQDARHRAPEASRILVEGDRFSAAVTARFTPSGIEETVAATLDVPGGAPGLDGAIERLRLVLGELTRNSLPTFALVLARVGESNRCFRPVEYPPPNPVVLLIGAPSVERLDLHERVFAENQDVVVVGSHSHPAFLLPLGSSREQGWDRLHDALDSVGGDNLTTLVAEPLRQAWEDDLHGDIDLHGEAHPHDARDHHESEGSDAQTDEDGHHDAP